MSDKSHKLKKSTGGNPIAMNNPKKIVPAESEAYPKSTNGSKIAAHVRKKANEWPDAKRKELFERGMQIIYGGSGNCSAKVRS
jgi:hypothetical protein